VLGRVEQGPAGRGHGVREPEEPVCGGQVAELGGEDGAVHVLSRGQVGEVGAFRAAGEVFVEGRLAQERRGPEVEQRLGGLGNCVCVCV